MTITYTDGEFSGRVFKDREKAEKYAGKTKEVTCRQEDQNRTVHEKSIRVAQVANQLTGQKSKHRSEIWPEISVRIVVHIEGGFGRVSSS
jgi:hypothetical protein